MTKNQNRLLLLSVCSIMWGAERKWHSRQRANTKRTFIAQRTLSYVQIGRPAGRAQASRELNVAPRDTLMAQTWRVWTKMCRVTQKAHMSKLAVEYLEQCQKGICSLALWGPCDPQIAPQPPRGVATPTLRTTALGDVLIVDCTASCAW